ncbi:MAG: energy transducer TonB [Saprospiraceae bacterium]|nr:energy transducer TonB [Saprospiraceae bacterium]
MKAMILLAIALFTSSMSVSAQHSSHAFHSAADATVSFAKARFPNLHQYIQENLKYPIAAIESGTEGRVVAKVLIEADGSVKDVQIVQGLSWSCDRAVTNLLKKMPKWVPATKNGQPVAQQASVAVRFKLKAG